MIGVIFIQSKDIKSYLLEDLSRIQKVLEEAGFHEIHHLSDEIRCALPGRMNSSSVSVKLNENLTTAIYSMDFYGDIFGALEKVMDISFKESVTFVASLFGLSTKNEATFKNPLTDLLSLTAEYHDKVVENERFSKSILNGFIALPHISLLREGISPDVCRQFNICFDPQESRILFPHFDWEDKEKVVGIKGRTTFDKSIVEELNIPKYWNYIKGYKKTNNLYGFTEAKPNLKKSKMLILFEAEKSVLKQFTLTRGEGYSVALGGHTISETQVEYILKHTPSDCEIVIAFDKDVISDQNFGEQGFKSLGELFKPFRKVSYICDKYDVLGEKDSPIDKGMKIWEILLKYRKNV